MCGRYWIDPDERIQRIIADMQRRDGVKTEGEIFPGDRVPVLCRSRAGNVRPFGMEWGWSLAGGKRLINARSETAGEKNMFRESMTLRRCLLPMSAYFEWEKAGSSKIKHRIFPEEGGLHFLAGLYRFEGEKPVCTVLTTAADKNIAFIHHRMPVILTEEEQLTWLGGGEYRFEATLPLAHAPAQL